MKQLEGFQIEALLSSPEPDDPQDAEAGQRAEVVVSGARIMALKYDMEV